MVFTTTPVNTSTSTSIPSMEHGNSRVVGGGSPASPLSSPLPHTHLSNGRSDLPISVPIEVQTDISILPLEEFKAPTVTNANEDDEIFYDCQIGDIVLPEPVRVLEFNVGEDITVESLKHDITFKKFGARKVAHFGSVKYSYGGIVHLTCQYPDSEALKSIISRMQHNIPGFDIDRKALMFAFLIPIILLIQCTGVGHKY